MKWTHLFRLVGVLLLKTGGINRYCIFFRLVRRLFDDLRQWLFFGLGAYAFEKLVAAIIHRLVGGGLSPTWGGECKWYFLFGEVALALPLVLLLPEMVFLVLLLLVEGEQTDLGRLPLEWLLTHFYYMLPNQ